MGILHIAAQAFFASSFLAGNVRAGIHNRPNQGPDPEKSIQLCLAGISSKEGSDYDSLVQALTIQLEQLQTSTTLIPLALPFASFPILGNKELTGHYGLPAGTLEGFQWFSSTIPASYDASRQCPSTVDLVFPFTPPFDNLQVCPLPPSQGMQLPFIHETLDPSTRGFKKFGIVPACLAPFIGIPLEQVQSNSDLTSVFAMNLEDRGDNNLRKRQYMSALTCDKLGFYEPKIQGALHQLVEELTDNPNTPVLSTWFELVKELFLDFHFGQVDHPDYVRRFFSRAFATNAGLSELSSCDQDNLAAATCEVAEVKKYVAQRVQAIVKKKDKTTITYWWFQAGLPADSIIQESIHNTLAFNQFVSTPFLVITAKIVGRLAIGNLAAGPQLTLDGTKLDFFQKYADALNDEDRLNVNREAWRLLLPNNLWMSSLEDSINSPQNQYGFVETSKFDYRGAAHIPFFIQAINDGYNPQTTNTSAYEYSTDRYKNFQATSDTASGKCPFLQGEGDGSSEDEDNLLAPEDFETSPIDGETMIPEGHENIIPLYATPKYCPFGLGYRRCPAEAMNMMFMDNMLEILGELDFEVRGEGPIELGELVGGVPCSDGVPSGIICRRDNIFVIE